MNETSDCRDFLKLMTRMPDWMKRSLELQSLLKEYEETCKSLESMGVTVDEAAIAKKVATDYFEEIRTGQRIAVYDSNGALIDWALKPQSQSAGSQERSNGP